MDIEKIDIDNILYKNLVFSCQGKYEYDLDALNKELINAQNFLNKNKAININGLHSEVYLKMKCLLFWRKFKTIIDADNLIDVSNTTINEKINMNILENLPFDFFIMSFKNELFLIFIEDKSLFLIEKIYPNVHFESINFTDAGFLGKLDTIENMLNEYLKHARHIYGSASKKLAQQKFYPIFNILIYMATQNSKLKSINVIEKDKKLKSIKNKTKNQKRILEVDFKISTFDLSKPKIKYEYKEPNEHTQKQNRTLTSHVRKAHWHSFWIGSKKFNTRKLTVKWVSETLIKGNHDPIKIKKLK